MTGNSKKDYYFNKDGEIFESASPHSPHQIIKKLIKPNTTILDIGCNTGILGKSIKHQNNTIDGVDINSSFFTYAKPYYRNLYKIDLSKNFSFNQEKYDYLIASDILEHLPNPDKILIKFRDNLKTNGLLITSIPNVARIEIRLNLLLGKFNYSKGIMSTDHLRFFTHKTASTLLSYCGYDIIHTIPTGLGHMLKILPNLTAFQFIFICKKND
jgi:2-polyprenyl-3-methyl-5-hydroxy-6-metoxy-1,4-benzoquinol methylase